MVIHYYVSCIRTVSLPPDFTVRGMLLYIEDIDGKGGLFDYYFGDVVALNPETGEKYIITKDRFYDEDPSAPDDGRRVIFQSCRFNGFDLSADRNLFIINFSDGKEIWFDRDFDKRFSVIELSGSDEYPVWSHDGEKVAFRTYDSTWRDKILIYSFKDDTLVCIKEGIFKLDKIAWSDDDKYIAYMRNLLEDLYSAQECIDILDTESKEVICSIIDSSSNLVLGDFRKGKVLYIKIRRVGKDRSYYLLEYNIDTREDRLLFEFRETGISSVVYGRRRETVYYIRDVMDESNHYINCDIYSLNLDTGEIERITSDGHEKMDLFYCRGLGQAVGE